MWKIHLANSRWFAEGQQCLTSFPWFPRITLTASGTKPNFLWGQKKDQPFLETSRISTTSIGKSIRQRLFSHRVIINVSQINMALRKHLHSHWFDFIKCVGSHATKSSPWKYSCPAFTQYPVPLHPSGSEERPVCPDTAAASSFHTMMWTKHPKIHAGFTCSVPPPLHFLKISSGWGVGRTP